MNELALWDPSRAGTGMPDATRWDPFQDSFFDFALLRPVARRAAWSGMRMDVMETEGAYQLAVELPGVKKEAIQVSINEATVSISAEQPEVKPAGEDANWLLRERSFGKFSRAITLPEAVDESASEARYVDGVLYLSLKKTSATRSKRITVN